MDLARKVRDFAGLPPIRMAEKMGKKIQCYQSLERISSRITQSDLKRLLMIYTEHGGTPEAFAKLVRECR